MARSVRALATWRRMRAMERMEGGVEIMYLDRLSFNLGSIKNERLLILATP